MPIDEASDTLPLPSLPLLAMVDLQDQLMTASNDLQRLESLLEDACRTLLERFHAATDELRGRKIVEDAGCERALQHIGAAVTALQFQDLASQLIGHTGQRLRYCTDRLAGGAFDADADTEGAPLLQPAPSWPNPVTQSEMDAGSVELF